MQDMAARSYRRRFETAIALAVRRIPPPRYKPTFKPGSVTCWPSRTTASGSLMPDDHRVEILQFTYGELDRYANQLTRCLKALGTSAPIRRRVHMS